MDGREQGVREGKRGIRLGRGCLAIVIIIMSIQEEMKRGGDERIGRIYV